MPMKQLNYIYDSKENFLNYLLSHDIDLTSENILIQMFTSVLDKNEVETVATHVCETLPNAQLIGTSTAGEIVAGKMIEGSIVLSISVFEKTSVHAVYADAEESYTLGLQMASEVLQDETKCVITFVNALKYDGEEYLEGFNSLHVEDVVIAGGMAGDTQQFAKTFVIFKNKIYYDGAVGVSLSSKELEVYQDYNLGWKAVGPEFTITKSKDNCVYEIDNKPVSEFYKEVLGDEAVENMPNSTIEFPLILEEDGMMVARSMVAVNDDGGIFYAGALPQGKKVRFGLGSLSLVNQYHPNEKLNLEEEQLEAAFVYSCSARKQFLGKKLEKTFEKINNIAPLGGFFTYGEFYSYINKIAMLNITTTLLFLRENKVKTHKIPIVEQKKNEKPKSKTDTAFFHLVDFVSNALIEKDKELDQSKFALDEYMHALDSVVIISKTDAKGIITYANEAFEKISGYKKEELIGHPHNIVRHPETSATTFKDLWQTIKQGKIWQGEFANRAKDGSTYYVKSAIVPIRNRDGDITEYMAIREDITSLVKGQKAYVNQLNFTNMLLDNEENIVVVTKNNQIDKMNKTFFETFAYEDLESFSSWHECICDLFLEKEGYLHKKNKPQMWFDDILKAPYKTHLAAMVDKNGEERIYKANSRKVQYDEETLYIIHTFNDITELELAKQKAQQAEAAQAMFLANMSHEIRTPMNGILGFSELLSQTQLNDTQKKYVDIVMNSTQTLLNLINDILDSSKIANEKIELEQIDINSYVELSKTFELLTSVAAKKSLIYENKFDTKMFECVKSDATRLRQILTNLLSNAIKFTPEHGEVIFQTQVLGINERLQTIRFSVQDSGIGISKDKQEKIFKPFSQADDSTTRKFGGTGLGLSISYDLVKAFGGELKVESTEGEGSKFYFDLQFEKCENKHILKETLSNYELFIIDDEDRFAVDMLEDTLKAFSLDYTIVSKSQEFNSTFNNNSLVFTFDKKVEQSLLQHLSREQIICITDRCDEQELECADITIDEAFASHLYNFLLTKANNIVTQSKCKSEISDKKLDILVAEDYDINRMLIESVFEKYKNIKLDFAHDGKEAVQKVKENQYDIILMDINMPQMNGMDATKIIRQELGKNLPIIALTANSLEGDKERFVEAGMDDYLSKPLNTKELEKILVKYTAGTEKENEQKQEQKQESPLEIVKIIENINKNLGVNDAISIKLLTSFSKSLSESVKQLQEAFEADDRQNIADIAHKLKGSSSTLGLNEIAELMQKIEEEVKSEEKISYNEYIAIINKFVNMLNRGLSDVS